MPYISETDYQNLHHTIIRLSESNDKLLARIQELETACLPIKKQLAFVFETDTDDKPLKLTMTAKECRTLAALLNNTPLEKE